MHPTNPKKQGFLDWKPIKFFVLSILALTILASGAYLFYRTEDKNAQAAGNTPCTGPSSSITGQLGNNLPNISLGGGCNYIDNAVINLSLEGCESPVSGKINATQSGSVWTPDSGTMIPNCALVGLRSATLRSSSLGEVYLTTNFNLSNNQVQITSIFTNEDAYLINFVKGTYTNSTTGFYFTESDPNYRLGVPRPGGTYVPFEFIDSNSSPVTIPIKLTPAIAQKICFEVLSNPSNFTEIPNSGNCVNLPAVTIIDDSNISTGTCTPDTVIIGQKVTCEFPLSGGSYYINLNIKAQIQSTASSDISQDCNIQNNTKLICTNIPTASGTVGNKSVILILTNNQQVQKATVTLAASTINNGIRTGKLYFVGKDNATPVWDINSEFNSTYLQSQKYKDGAIKMVYDEIKNSSGNTITTGNCTFNLYRYGNAGSQQNILRSYNAAITNGKCEATFPVIDQTVNYYRVRVTALETGTSGASPIYNMDTLILSVGGSSSTTGPGIEL